MTFLQWDSSVKRIPLKHLYILWMENENQENNDFSKARELVGSTAQPRTLISCLLGSVCSSPTTATHTYTQKPGGA